MTAIISGASLAVPAAPNVPSCGVLAVANFAEVSYEEAWLRFLKFRKAPGRWKGRTYDHERAAVLTELGVDWVELNAYNRMTIGLFVRDYAAYHTRYKVMVSGHVVTVYNGIITDQTGAGNWNNHKMRFRRIIATWERLT